MKSPKKICFPNDTGARNAALFEGPRTWKHVVSQSGEQKATPDHPRDFVSRLLNFAAKSLRDGQRNGRTT